MPYYYLVLAAAALGSLGSGLTIASLARTQREASMGALCYTMAVALTSLVLRPELTPNYVGNGLDAR